MIVTYKWQPETTDADEIISATFNADYAPRINEEVNINVTMADGEPIVKSGIAARVVVNIDNKNTELVIHLLIPKAKSKCM